MEGMNGPARYASKNPRSIITNVPAGPNNSTRPMFTAPRIASFNPPAIASMLKSILARFWELDEIVSRSETESETISRRASAHTLAAGGLNHPVRSVFEVFRPKSGSRTLSVGPPELHARTGMPQAMASTGTIPKCSFAGVYSKARVLELRRRAVRWKVVKLRRNRTWGSGKKVTWCATLDGTLRGEMVL